MSVVGASARSRVIAGALAAWDQRTRPSASGAA